MTLSEDRDRETRSTVRQLVSSTLGRLGNLLDQIVQEEYDLPRSVQTLATSSTDRHVRWPEYREGAYEVLNEGLLEQVTIPEDMRDVSVEIGVLPSEFKFEGRLKELHPSLSTCAHLGTDPHVLTLVAPSNPAALPDYCVELNRSVPGLSIRFLRPRRVQDRDSIGS